MPQTINLDFYEMITFFYEVALNYLFRSVNYAAMAVKLTTAHLSD